MQPVLPIASAGYAQASCVYVSDGGYYGAMVSLLLPMQPGD